MDIFEVSLDRAAVDLVTPIEANQRFFLKTLDMNTDDRVSPVHYRTRRTRFSPTLSEAERGRDSAERTERRNEILASGHSRLR
jgi:hypothetical protein